MNHGNSRAETPLPFERLPWGHDAGIDAEAAFVLGEGHVSNPMVFVLHGPMVVDGAREGFRGRHDG